MYICGVLFSVGLGQHCCAKIFGLMNLAHMKLSSRQRFQNVSKWSGLQFCNTVGDDDHVLHPISRKGEISHPFEVIYEGCVSDLKLHYHYQSIYSASETSHSDCVNSIA